MNARSILVKRRSATMGALGYDQLSGLTGCRLYKTVGYGRPLHISCAKDLQDLYAKNLWLAQLRKNKKEEPHRIIKTVQLFTEKRSPSSANSEGILILYQQVGHHWSFS